MIFSVMPIDGQNFEKFEFKVTLGLMRYRKIRAFVFIYYTKRDVHEKIPNFIL